MQVKIGKELNLLLVLFTLVSHFGLAQKPIVALTVDKKELGPDEHCTFTVTSNVEGSVKIDFPVELEVDYGVMHGMEQKMDPSGKIKTFYYMQQSGMFKKSGVYSFYAYVTFRNKVYKSNKLTVKVDESFEQENNRVRTEDPVFGFIQCKKTTVYEGEPILLKAKVFSFMNIEYLEGYSDYKADLSMESHAFSNGRVEVEGTKMNGKDALTFEYGKQLLIPIATGKCKIQPFEMALRCQGSIFGKTIRFRSSALTIQVKPLPGNAPYDFIGAVGSYKLSQKSPQKTVQEGEVFTLELTVIGTGNIHNSNAPKLNLPKGCSLYGDPERMEDVDYTEDGVTGRITYRYNIQVLQEEDLHMKAPSVSYFDPEKERYITVYGESFDIDVIPSKTFDAVATTTPSSSNHADTKWSNKVIQPKKSTDSKNAKHWLVTIGAPAGGLLSLFLILALVRKNKNKSTEEPAEIRLEDKPISFITSTEALVSVVERDYWKEAEEALNHPNEFSVLLPKAIIQRVEKMECCAFQSREKAFDKLHDKNPSMANELRAVIEACDQYRYGFGAEELKTKELWLQVESIFARI